MENKKVLITVQDHDSILESFYSKTTPTPLMDVTDDEIKVFKMLNKVIELRAHRDLYDDIGVKVKDYDDLMELFEKGSMDYVKDHGGSNDRYYPEIPSIDSVEVSISKHPTRNSGRVKIISSYDFGHYEKYKIGTKLELIQIGTNAVLETLTLAKESYLWEVSPGEFKIRATITYTPKDSDTIYMVKESESFIVESVPVIYKHSSKVANGSVQSESTYDLNGLEVDKKVVKLIRAYTDEVVEEQELRSLVMFDWKDSGEYKSKVEIHCNIYGEAVILEKTASKSITIIEHPYINSVELNRNEMGNIEVSASYGLGTATIYNAVVQIIRSDDNKVMDEKLLDFETEFDIKSDGTYVAKVIILYLNYNSNKKIELIS